MVLQDPQHQTVQKIHNAEQIKRTLQRAGTRIINMYLRNKPYSKKTKDNGIIWLAIMPWDANMKIVPDISLPFLQLECSRSNVKQNDIWRAFHQPSAIIHLCRWQYVMTDDNLLQQYMQMQIMTDNNKSCSIFVSIYWHMHEIKGSVSLTCRAKMNATVKVAQCSSLLQTQLLTSSEPKSYAVEKTILKSAAFYQWNRQVFICFLKMTSIKLCKTTEKSESHLKTMVSHLLKSTSDSLIWRFHEIQLSSDTCLIVWTDEKIPISKFFYCHCSLCPDYCVYTANYTNKMSHM